MSIRCEFKHFMVLRASNFGDGTIKNQAFLGDVELLLSKSSGFSQGFNLFQDAKYLHLHNNCLI